MIQSGQFLSLLHIYTFYILPAINFPEPVLIPAQQIDNAHLLCDVVIYDVINAAQAGELISVLLKCIHIYAGSNRNTYNPATIILKPLHILQQIS